MNGKFIVVDPTQLCGWPLQLHHYNPRVSSLIVQFRSLGVSFSRPSIPLPVFFLRSRNFDDSFRRNAEGERRGGEKSFIALVNRPTFILLLSFSPTRSLQRPIIHAKSGGALGTKRKAGDSSLLNSYSLFAFRFACKGRRVHASFRVHLIDPPAPGQTRGTKAEPVHSKRRKNSCKPRRKRGRAARRVHKKVSRRGGSSPLFSY